MKFLTPVYLTLMHAFNDRVADVLSKFSTDNRIVNMQEYCTLRLDGGRQSGKTEAVAQFSREWLDSGGQVIILADTQKYAELTRSRIGRRKDVFCQSIRQFLSNSCVDRYRGISLSKPLIIIDEPCSKMPEIYKFYKSFEDNLVLRTVSSGFQLPLFFVIGIQ